MIKVRISIDQTGQSFICSLDPQTRISAHFRLIELANNKGNKNIPQYEINRYTGQFMANIEALRDKVNEPMNLNSCYRQPAYNLSVGGSSNSLHAPTEDHPGGLAIDWSLKKLTDARYIQIRDWWFGICRRTGHIPGINRYTNGLHLSYDEALLGYTEAQERDYRGKKGDW